MGLKDWLITTETVIHKMVVDPKEGTAVGLVETVYYGPKRTGGQRLHSATLSCVCHDIYRRHLTWTDINGMADLLPKYNTAKSLSRRLRTEINKLVAEGKINGESIIRDAYRQPTA
ncbi:hypothetical protein MPK64_gp071 [Erwinia phage pEa_SNUABM_16]|uniref:Uncharacterized protein n=1 Tax=Erwinia phage pEa_SNUABM_16 TaxID=2869544 RepID=A0AAE8XQG0_9CAUD|nr:hypothetical protein MPK64_gp071 [Erwinia phage pEa_SNUABM_16]QZE58974.1 hypothetical protein pEaSNUABM18_00071 [Erwinia phage pEa_SNUABM_18]UAW96215.1 hypothetical protein pEaSNUABM16_00071 [Erwinia phage pEa_SNUABM_16]